MLFFEMRGKAQKLGHIGAVDRKRRSRQRAGPQRQNIDPFQRFAKALAVALEHIVVGKQMMREQHRLRPLQVRVSRHDHIEMSFRRTRRARAAERSKPSMTNSTSSRKIQPHVERDLIVAAARRVQLAAGRADLFGQTPLDIHMDVFVGRRKAKLAAARSRARIASSPRTIFRASRRGNDALLCQHFRMGDAAHDIVSDKAAHRHRSKR